MSRHPSIVRDHPPHRQAPCHLLLDRGLSNDIVARMLKTSCTFAVMLMVAATLPSVAQERTILNLRRGDDAVLWQARSCIGEVGWSAPDAACVAMTWIHAKRAKLTGVSLSTMVRAYSAAVRAPRARVPVRHVAPQGGVVLASTATGSFAAPPSRTARRRQWLSELSRTGEAPSAWPNHLRRAWPRYRTRFREVYDLVERVVAGEIEDPCPNATFYGGPMDSPPAGHEPDPECAFEGTAQLFYRRSSGQANGS